MNGLRFGAALGLVLLVQARDLQAQSNVQRGERSEQKGALSDDTELARIVGLYEAGRYANCADELAHLLDPRSPRPLRNPEVVERARLYHAACLIGRGTPELADEPLRAAIRHNSQMKPPDSLDFPPPVVERFLRVREALLDEIRAEEAMRVQQAQAQALIEKRKVQTERARLAELEHAVRYESIVLRNRRWIASVPFGVGQFQNANYGLGWVFFSTEAALAASALLAMSIRTSIELEIENQGRQGQVTEPGVNARLHNWHTLFVASSWGLVGTMLVGVLEAQISFVPELREKRLRSSPMLPGAGRKTGFSLRLLPLWGGGHEGIHGGGFVGTF